MASTRRSLRDILRQMSADASDPTRVRIDVWLDVACLFKTRSEAQRACKSGKIEINGVRVKPHREIGAGEEIEITRPLGRRQRVAVVRLADRHLAKRDARALYTDLTPPLSPEELEARRLERLVRAMSRAPSGRPDKRDRRLLQKLKGNR